MSDIKIVTSYFEENLKEKYSDITPRKLDHTIWKSLH